MAFCEMCGKDSFLVRADVEGVELKVCKNCTKYGKVKHEPSKRRFPSKNRKPRTEEPQFRIVSNYSSLLKKAREEKGMSLEDFSSFLQEKESVVSKWESGSMKPRIGVARRIGKKLNVRLIEKDEDESTEKYTSKKKDEFTLGDFIKVRKRK